VRAILILDKGPGAHPGPERTAIPPNVRASAASRASVVHDRLLGECRPCAVTAMPLEGVAVVLGDDDAGV
jgi:hypothetical protein